VRHSRTSGFSFTELILAFSVLAISIGVMVPSMRRYLQASRTQSTLEDIVRIEDAMKAYLLDVGTLEPLADIDGFSSDTGGPAVRHFQSGDNQPGWDGPYLQRIRTYSALGPRFDIQVIKKTQARIDLPVSGVFHGNFAASVAAIDRALDTDSDTTKGRVWSDASGIHIGMGYAKP